VDLKRQTEQVGVVEPRHVARNLEVLALPYPLLGKADLLRVGEREVADGGSEGLGLLLFAAGEGARRQILLEPRAPLDDLQSGARR
jgi:hypothetical protein